MGWQQVNRKQVEKIIVFTLSIYNTNEMPVYYDSEVGVKAGSIGMIGQSCKIRLKSVYG